MGRLGYWLDVGTSDDMESFFMLTEKHGCCGICNPPSRDRRVQRINADLNTIIARSDAIP